MDFNVQKQTLLNNVHIARKEYDQIIKFNLDMLYHECFKPENYWCLDSMLSKYNIEKQRLLSSYLHTELVKKYGKLQFDNYAVKINRNYYYRKTRLTKSISKLLNKPCLFLTITFTNKTLNTTSYVYRRNLISRLLQKYLYIANVDYGELNGREHYHAIIQSDSIDCQLFKKYGTINAQHIYNPDDERLAKYISKLTNHAIKNSTKNSRIIYSKGLNQQYKERMKDYNPIKCLIK